MLTRVPPEQISPEDLAALQRADDFGPRGCSIPLDEIVRGIWSGAYQLFRTNCGVMLTEIVNRRVNIVRLEPVGKLALRSQEFARDLQHIARELDCNAIETSVYSERLARALRRGGAKQEAIVMVLELDNG